MLMFFLSPLLILCVEHIVTITGLKIYTPQNLGFCLSCIVPFEAAHLFHQKLGPQILYKVPFENICTHLYYRIGHRSSSFFINP